MKNSIGERINELRVNRGINQTEFAVLLGVGQKAVSLIERGVNNPTIAQLIILSDSFGVSIDWIIKGVDTVGTSDERELLNAIKDDTGLHQSMKIIMNAKKNIMSNLQAA